MHPEAAKGCVRVRACACVHAFAGSRHSYCTSTHHARGSLFQRYVLPTQCDVGANDGVGSSQSSRCEHLRFRARSGKLGSETRSGVDGWLHDISASTQKKMCCVTLSNPSAGFCVYSTAPLPSLQKAVWRKCGSFHQAAGSITLSPVYTSGERANNASKWVLPMAIQRSAGSAPTHRAVSRRETSRPRGEPMCRSTLPMDNWHLGNQTTSSDNRSRCHGKSSHDGLANKKCVYTLGVVRVTWRLLLFRTRCVCAHQTDQAVMNLFLSDVDGESRVPASLIGTRPAHTVSNRLDVETR